MARRAIIGACVAALAGVFWLGCQSSTEPGPGDEEKVRNLIDNEYKAYFDDSSANGGRKPEGGDFLSELVLSMDGKATLPIAWYRALTFAKRTYWIKIEAPFTTAEVIVEDDLQGLMYIDRSDNKIFDPGSKPFAVTRKRYATFERETTDHPWELTAISPAVYSVQGAGRQTVTITSVRLVTENGYDRTFTDMAEPIPLTELPQVKYGEKITVTVEAENTSGAGWAPKTFCFLHHDWHRWNMNREGSRTFTGEYSITAEPGVRHGGVSAIDAGTLQNETKDDYNADGWSLPFEVSE
ncbi:MAG: hypothetical protein JSU81_03040 [Candidatus Coatesbacteria bacterium]|nr:MAG: hypothetical protein JSU81_03040 [Candidatus Coatesbacteria bacterium]